MTNNKQVNELGEARAFTANEAEAFLRGAAAPHNALADFAPIVESLRVASRSVPVPARVDAMAAELASVALDATPARALARDHRTIVKRSTAMKTRARIASATGAFIALAMGSTGVAFAADQAIPGDPLYDLNRALEDFGILDGGLDERIDEAEQLLDNGDEEAAIEHLAESLEEEAEALEEEGDVEGAEELRTAAAAVLSAGSAESLAVRTAVAEMLQWMAETDAKGKDFGQGVAARANAMGGNGNGDEDVIVDEDGNIVDEDGNIVDEDGNIVDEDGNVIENGTVLEDGTVVENGKGKPADAGKPAGVGKPAELGRGANFGNRPADAGRPANAGRPSNS